MTGGFNEVYHALDALEQSIHAAAESAMDEAGHLLANYAKTNHLWQDRTGNTTASTIGGLVESTRELVRGALSAGMDYDVFLELAREGRWAWLLPAVEANKLEILLIFNRHLSEFGLSFKRISVGGRTYALITGEKSTHLRDITFQIKD